MIKLPFLSEHRDAVGGAFSRITGSRFDVWREEGEAKQTTWVFTIRFPAGYFERPGRFLMKSAQKIVKLVHTSCMLVDKAGPPDEGAFSLF